MGDIIESIPHNPFQPPASDTEHHGLSPETEFLVSDKCILCGDQIELPRFCIESGTTNDLVSRSATLKCWPPLLSRLCLIFLLVLCPIVANAALFARRRTGGAGPRSLWENPAFWTSIAIGVFSITVVLFVLARRFTRHIQVTWFVENRILMENRLRSKHHLKWALVWAAGFVALVVLANYWEGAAGFLVFTVVSGFLCVSQSRQKTQPTVVGQHKGLNILKGLSPAFLREVQSLIDRHNGGNSGYGNIG